MNVTRALVHHEQRLPSQLELQPVEAEPRPFLWVPLLLAFVRRRWRMIGLCGALAACAVLAYAVMRTPSFAATTELLVDTRRAPMLRQQQAVGSDPAIENAFVESQVEVLRSAGVAHMVVVSESLAKDPEFAPPGSDRPGPLASAAAKLRALLSLDTPEPARGPAADGPEEVATEALMRATSVRRVGMSYVVNVTVSARQPEKAARLANAVAEAYYGGQLSAGRDVSERASDWMEGRIRELREQATAADRAVQEYRIAKNIVDTERGMLYEQQIEELSTQLSRARAERAQAQAIWARAKSAAATGRLPTDLADVLGSPTITRLRERESEALRRATEIISRSGPAHPDRRAADAELVALRGQILAEARRVVASYESVVDASRAREAELEQRLAELVGISGQRNVDRIALRSLESTAHAYRRLHDSFLERYTQVVQDQSFPISDVRVVTRAKPPARPSGPRLLVLLMVGAPLGLAFGIALAALREALDRGLRTPGQLRAATGLDCAALVPRVRRWRRLRAEGKRGAAGMIPETAGGSTVPTRSHALRHIVTDPYSAYSEAVRTVALRASQQRLGHGMQVIGCMSAVPGTGGSTFAANLAHCLALQGSRTLLVDLDLRCDGDWRSLTRALVPPGWDGFVEAAQEQVPVVDLLWRDSESGLRFLPAFGRPPARHPAEIMSSARVAALLAELRAAHDHVVLDLPALSSGADAQVAQGLADLLVVNLQWGSPPPGVLIEALPRLGLGNTVVLGAVLNSANVAVAARYAAGEAAAWRPRQYARA